MSSMELHPRKVVLLGATGSIGTQALEVIRESAGMLSVDSLAARSDVEGTLRAALEFRPDRVALADSSAVGALSAALEDRLGGDSPEVLSGDEGVRELAAGSSGAVVLNAIVGSAGLLPSLAALDAGALLALANKESLVMAGPLVMDRSRGSGGLVPVDSEHSSLFRLVRAHDPSRVRSITLTASGGAFRDWPLERMKGVTPEQALNHPVWNMGNRITVDSATMMNKALEVIEAQHLFDLDSSRVNVVIHPQAYVHGLIELEDGTLMAHIGVPDMKIPIAYALYYPSNSPAGEPAPDLAALGSLTFESPDRERFPCLDLGYRAAEEGGTSPAALNAADEVAVQAFLAGTIAFTDIPRIVKGVLDERPAEDVDSPEHVLEVDRWARDRAAQMIAG